jgi:two-component system, sensor histidine kinase and response regulator
MTSYSDKKVLLVEDDQILRDILVPDLSQHFTVLTAADGKQAMDVIQTKHPHLILLDLLLPEMDGFNVLENLRSMKDTPYSQTPVIILTNLGDPQSIMKAQQFGIQSYFTKSDLKMSSLIREIESLLTNHPLP